MSLFIASFLPFLEIYRFSWPEMYGNAIENAESYRSICFLLSACLNEVYRRISYEICRKEIRWLVVDLKRRCILLQYRI